MEIALTKQINIEISPLIVRANSLRRLLPQVTTNQTYKTFARNLKKRKKRIFMKIVVVTTKHWTSPLIVAQGLQQVKYTGGWVGIPMGG